MRQIYRQKPYKKQTNYKKRKRLVVFGLVLLGFILAIYWLFFNNATVTAPETSIPEKSQQVTTKKVDKYQPVDLQQVIDTWANKQSASYHIMVYDKQSQSVIAEHDASEQLFAASLYKIYVAYLTLLDIQNNKMNPNEALSTGFSLKQCVDKMIRESHSPCGETVMAKQGQLNLNKRVKELGMNNTIFNGISTSAEDCVAILKIIDDQKVLNKENTNFLKDAMKEQPDKFEKGLKAGAPKASWETKVGWNLDQNYHDIGIMTMPDKRVFYVAILGQGSGKAAPLADFAKTIYQELDN